MAELLKKRKSGIPTGNAGEYFVMGELLRRGYDAQLADRNTKGYDLLVCRADEPGIMHQVQVKTVRQQPWYVKIRDFEGDYLNQATVYVLLGSEDCKKPIRYFVSKNHTLSGYVDRQPGWPDTAFMTLKSVIEANCEDQWDVLFE